MVKIGSPKVKYIATTIYMTATASLTVDPEQPITAASNKNNIAVALQQFHTTRVDWHDCNKMHNNWYWNGYKLQKTIRLTKLNKIILSMVGMGKENTILPNCVVSDSVIRSKLIEQSQKTCCHAYFLCHLHQLWTCQYIQKYGDKYQWLPSRNIQNLLNSNSYTKNKPS